MSRIIERGYDEVRTHRERVFHYEGDPGWGFTFPVDAEGRLTNPNPEARANWDACMTGTAHGRPVVDEGVRVREEIVKQPAIIKCDCGARVTAHRGSWMGVHTCDRCGRDYNSAGQELAPRHQWGEETGESYSDLMTGYDPERIGSGGGYQ